MAALERIGGERKVSLVKKRPAQHNEREVAQHVEPAEAPARAETASQPPPNNIAMLSSMESRSLISDLAVVFGVAGESEHTNSGVNGARSSTCDEGTCRLAVTVADGKQKLAVPIWKKTQAERWSATTLADRLCKGDLGSLLEMTAARDEFCNVHTEHLTQPCARGF